jgi:hypothetical protein
MVATDMPRTVPGSPRGVDGANERWVSVEEVAAHVGVLRKPLDISRLVDAIRISVG